MRRRSLRENNPKRTRCVETSRSSHLQQVVLHDVADDADAVKIATAALRPKWLLEGDLPRACGEQTRAYGYRPTPRMCGRRTCMLEMYSRFQMGSNTALAKRSTMRFCTISLPR